MGEWYRASLPSCRIYMKSPGILDYCFHNMAPPPHPFLLQALDVEAVDAAEEVALGAA